MSHPGGAVGDVQPGAGARAVKNFWPWVASAAAMGVAALQLRRQGRLWWCACGQLYLWWGDIRSAHTSQHLLDPYSVTHVLHGVVLCGLLAWGVPKLSPPWRFCLAVSLESLWEVLENTDFIIQRYRVATLALGYHGDTIVNSLGDILSSAVGYALARRLGFRGSLALIVALEVFLLMWVKDSLLLNIVMLIHPIEAIKAWQLGR